MNFYILFILFIISGCNLTTSNNNNNNSNNNDDNLNQIEETSDDNDNEPDNTNVEGNNEPTTVINNNANNDLDVDYNFIASLKTIDKSKLESSLTSFVINQLENIIEPDKKLAKIKKILDSDIIFNIYHNDPTKFKHFYDKCNYYIALKDKEEFNDYVKNILLKDDNVKVFLEKGYSTAFASLPSLLQQKDELQAKYVSYLINNNQINNTVENIANSNEHYRYKNEKLHTLYKNGAQQYVVNLFNNDYIDSLNQQKLLEIANILGYQIDPRAIKDSTLFATNSNISVPYVKHRYNLFKALNPSQIIFEEYDRILGKLYDFTNFLQKLLNESTDKNKDIDFLLNHPDSKLSQEQKNNLQAMKNA